MARNLLNRYIWIIDTIRRHGSIRLDSLNELWLMSDVSDGEPLVRRTFYNYRQAIFDLFKINIECDRRSYEYYIAQAENSRQGDITDWMLNTASMSTALTEVQDIADRVFLEDVPSARQYLSVVIDAVRRQRRLSFKYAPFTRTGAPKPTTIEPYFLKIFKLRWYVTGLNVKDNQIKTYALDRMSDATIADAQFEMPAGFDPEEFARDSFGIVFSQGEVKRVAIKATPRQAKYLRALPLHHSQSEMIHDEYSIFYYNLRLTNDFVEELLSFGSSVTVMAPPELRAMMETELRETLKNYQQ